MPLFSIIIYAVLMSLIFAFRLLPESRIEAFNDGIIALVTLIGSVQLYRVTIKFQIGDESRICWFLFCIGLVNESIGHMIYSSYEFLYNHALPFPHMADALIIFGGILYIFSFKKFLKNLNQLDIIPPSNRKWIANGIIFLIVLFNVFFIIFPMISDDSEVLWLRLMYLIYPVIDLVLTYYCFHLALTFLAIGQSPVAKPWWILVLAFIIFLITDSMYAYFEVIGIYHSYMWINPGWGLAYLFVSHAAYVQLKLMHQFEAMDFDDSLDFEYLNENDMKSQ